uniref:Cadherin domain-containing protein n=1 Tax=Panagrellus redivivus TaxID=6233 RepID=A0A7E4US38_PANRE
MPLSAAAPSLVPLTVSLFVATLRLIIDPVPDIPPNAVAFALISPNRNISFSIRDGLLFADSTPISKSPLTNEGTTFNFSARCLNDFALKLEANADSKVIPSPSLCRKLAQSSLLIGPDDGAHFHGCIRDVTLAGKPVASKWCRNPDDSANKIDSTSSEKLYADNPWQTLKHPEQPLYIGEKVTVNEGAAVPLQWKNFYLFPEHRRFGIVNSDVIFDVVEPPEHGQLQRDGEDVRQFNYDELIRRKIVYVNNGDENLDDSFDLQLTIKNSKIDFGSLKNRIYTIRIDINAINDPPQVVPGSKGTIVHVLPGVKTLLTEDNIKIWDADTPAERVTIRVASSSNLARITSKNGATAVTKFSLSDLLNHKIYASIVANGPATGTLKFDAVDSGGAESANSVELQITAFPIEIHMRVNAGLKLAHKATASITADKLQFELGGDGIPANIDAPLAFVIVDQPEFGIVECSKDGRFELCATFSQKDIATNGVRYRHTNDGRPKSDVFSFKVVAGDAETPVHDFNIEFIPTSVRVFISEALLLNNTKEAKITAANLLATTFPVNFAHSQLYYHIVEPPKYGMLSRKVEGNKNRRIGVSSNFTQQHVDASSVSYKLHFEHYSVVNDFFVFRLVTPAITSELLRFEITYIPGGHSIQLLNRTLIVAEGKSAPVTNNTLYLETPDDTTFDFVIGVAPFHGKFVLAGTDGSKFILGPGDSFDTFDLSERRLFYEHSGDESRDDRAYLIAKSRYKSNTRVPLWFTISVIAENDNSPEMIGTYAVGPPHVIYVIENGERTLTPSMFPWKDRDANGKAHLSYTFLESSFKDFVFFTKDEPQLPTRSFTWKDLVEGKLIVRHLSLKLQSQLHYKVSDGTHSVDATATIIAEKPFIRLIRNTIQLPALTHDYIFVNSSAIAAETNLNIDLGEITYEILGHSPFVLLKNGYLMRVSRFLQEDVFARSIFLEANTTSTQIKIKLSGGTLKSQGVIELKKAASDAPYFHLQLRQNIELNPGETVAKIDSNVFGVKNLQNARFEVVEAPKMGSLVLDTNNEKLKSILPSNTNVWGFYEADLEAQRLQYVTRNSSAVEDGFAVIIQSDRDWYGPFKFGVKSRRGSGITLTSIDALYVTENKPAVFGPQHVRFEIPAGTDSSEFEFRITKQPISGRLTTISEPMLTIDAFSIDQFNSGQISFRGNSPAVDDSFTFQLCSQNSGRCSVDANVKVHVNRENREPPEVVKNEPLVLFNTKTGVLTPTLLQVQDPDSSADDLDYFVWQPIGGYVATKADQSKPVNRFSQKDLNSGDVVFVSNSNSSGGFSFLVRDGLHQSRPEFFTVERTAKLSLSLEANSRLLAAPLQHTIIGMDLLRAVVPDVPATKAVYTISRAPIHGRIYLDKTKPVSKFTQADIDARRVSYLSDSGKLGAWSQKDYFNFIVSVEGKPSIKEEFRFRIVVTFGALTADSLTEFVTVKQPWRVCAECSVAINSDVIDLRDLETASGEELVMEIYRGPKRGKIVHVPELTDDDTASNSAEVRDETAGGTQFKAEAISSGRHLIYNAPDDGGDDEITFQVYSSKDQSKRSGRLRIPLFIEIAERPNMPEVSVNAFRQQLTLVSGGSAVLEPKDFQTDSASLSPTEITYSLVQKGSNGVKLVILDAPATVDQTFTQAQINKGQVRLEHTPLSSNDRFDVLVFSIGGAENMRALAVRIEPLALNLFNHSDITYEQGRTYVVLTRQHLGADSNGDRARIVYNITKPPQNGSFYWVAGEKEAVSFTQKNIDDGDILYAQLDMKAYQDSFDFTLGNEELEMLQKTSTIRVTPKIEAQDLITDARTITQVNVGYLNATALEGNVPSYFVTNGPNFGRLFLHPKPNESIVFFTQTNVNNGELFFHAFDVKERVEDEITLELRGDSVQPARFTWIVDIRPADKAGAIVPASGRNDGNAEAPVLESGATTPNMAPELNQHFPVIVLVAIVLITVLILCCRRKSSTHKKRKAKAAAERQEQALNLNLGISDRELPLLDSNGSDLLDQTVYASVNGRQPRHGSLGGALTKIPEESPRLTGSARTSETPTIRRKPTMETFEPPRSISPPRVKVTPLGTSSAFRPTPLAALNRGSRSGPITGLPPVSAASPMSPGTSRRPMARSSLDGSQRPSGLSGSTSKLKTSQYWV